MRLATLDRHRVLAKGELQRQGCIFQVYAAQVQIRGSEAVEKAAAKLTRTHLPRQSSRVSRPFCLCERETRPAYISIDFPKMPPAARKRPGRRFFAKKSPNIEPTPVWSALGKARPAQNRFYSLWVVDRLSPWARSPGFPGSTALPRSQFMESAGQGSRHGVHVHTAALLGRMGIFALGIMP